MKKRARTRDEIGIDPQPEPLPEPGESVWSYLDRAIRWLGKRSLKGRKARTTKTRRS